MRNIFFTLLLFSTINITAQISIYEEKSNSANQIIKLPEGMSYDEFLKIQKHVDCSKIIIASIVPGFIHFYADRENKGWAVVGIRTLGYGLMGYALINQYQLINDTKIDLNISDKQNRQNKNALFFAIGSFLNFAGFFYDWADGMLSIEEDRNMIYFKYGIDETQRLKLGLSINKINKYPMFNISFQL